jgi:hypothetical protein
MEGDAEVRQAMRAAASRTVLGAQACARNDNEDAD